MTEAFGGVGNRGGSSCGPGVIGVHGGHGPPYFGWSGVVAVKVKICGITTRADAELAVGLGADLLGFNFYEPSPRYVEPGAAGELAAGLGEGVVMVGVFVNATTEEIAAVAQRCRLDMAQLHGDESAEQCREVARLGLGVIKAVRVKGPEDVERVRDYEVDAVLLDAFREEVYGGSGHRFDWSWVRQAGHEKVFLAGGITPENVAEAVSVGTYGVDLCSGVEVGPGVKDEAKMRLLFERLGRGDE